MIDDRRPCVLIADDDLSIRRMLAVSLEREGYRTADACDGSEALAVMRAGRADLVLLDLMMPKVTGWEVLAQRAASPELRKIPVIVITAERGDRVAEISHDEICALLSKPFERETLRALVKSCLESGAAAWDRRPRAAIPRETRGAKNVVDETPAVELLEAKADSGIDDLRCARRATAWST